MTLVTQPLRDEHRELLPEVEVLRAAADGIEASDALNGVRAAIRFLAGHLIPHAEAEEAALYPVVGNVMGAPGATATMTRDHVEVRRLTEELHALAERWNGAPGQLIEARRLLYGLYTLVRVHFAKEEEVYLPLLDEKLNATEAAAMFAAMEARAGEAKAHGQS
jgi:hemerythrin-like domain-containing protein